MESPKVLRLKSEYRRAIIHSAKLQGDIADACNKSVASVLRWANNNAEQLTMLSALNVIRAHFNIDKNTALTEWISPQNSTREPVLS
jgi:hypothetical protein